MMRSDLEEMTVKANELAEFLNDPGNPGNPEDHYTIVWYLQQIRDLTAGCLYGPAYGEFRDEPGWCNTYEEEFC